MVKTANKYNAEANKQIVRSIIDNNLLDEDYDTLLQNLNEREAMMNKLLEKVRELAPKHLCFLDTDKEFEMLVNLDDDLDRLLMEDECMGHIKANAIVNVVGAVLDAIADELLVCREQALK